MTKYSQGTSLEYDIKFMLEYSDYYVMRSAGSHGIVDLAAWWENQCLMIQCKKKQEGYERKKRQELFELCKKLHCNIVPCFAYRAKLEIVTDCPKMASICIENMLTNKPIFIWPRKGIKKLQQIARDQKR